MGRRRKEQSVMEGAKEDGRKKKDRRKAKQGQEGKEHNGNRNTIFFTACARSTHLDVAGLGPPLQKLTTEVFLLV